MNFEKWKFIIHISKFEIEKMVKIDFLRSCFGYKESLNFNLTNTKQIS